MTWMLTDTGAEKAVKVSLSANHIFDSNSPKKKSTILGGLSSLIQWTGMKATIHRRVYKIQSTTHTKPIVFVTPEQFGLVIYRLELEVAQLIIFLYFQPPTYWHHTFFNHNSQRLNQEKCCLPKSTIFITPRNSSHYMNQRREAECHKEVRVRARHTPFRDTRELIDENSSSPKISP